MLAIGRALVLNPSRLVMDEPSEGLAPVVVDQLISACESLVNSGMSILLIEQNLRFATAVAENAHGWSPVKLPQRKHHELLSDQDLTRRYLEWAFSLAEVEIKYTRDKEMENGMTVFTRAGS